MRDELVEAVLGDPAGRYVDATFGRGGHARALLARLDPAARLLVLDRDPEAVEAARALASSDQRVTALHKRFSEIASAAAEAGFSSIDGAMFDIGVSSPQLDQAERGFSYRLDGPLDMRMDSSAGVTAQEWLNGATREEMARVFRDFGEERDAWRIAGAIERERPLATTKELADVIESAQRRPDRHKNASTRVFQAIRIFINRELDELTQALEAAWQLLRPGGRLAVISFHSLEDRIVKQHFRALARPTPLPRRLPVRADQQEPAQARSLPLQRARDTEVAANPRARSAILRAVERLR